MYKMIAMPFHYPLIAQIVCHGHGWFSKLNNGNRSVIDPDSRLGTPLPFLEYLQSYNSFYRTDEPRIIISPEHIYMACMPQINDLPPSLLQGPSREYVDMVNTTTDGDSLQYITNDGYPLTLTHLDRTHEITGYC